MIGNPGPFRIIQSDTQGCVDAPMIAPRRRYNCPNYTKCLNLAASLNWDNFTCRGCCGEVDDHLVWEAQKAKNIAAKTKPVEPLHSDIPEVPLRASISSAWNKLFYKKDLQIKKQKKKPSLQLIVGDHKKEVA